MQIELTEPEANDLIALLDVAVKAAGLQASRSALHFFDMLQAAANTVADVPVGAPSEGEAE